MAALRLKGKQSWLAQANRSTASLMESLEPRQLLSAGSVQKFVDTDGDLVRIVVNGGGTIAPIDPATRKIWVSGSGVSSTMGITVQRAAGGDGLVTLGEIRCFGPMLAINGPSATITNEITINDDNLPVSPANKVSINLGVLVNVALYTGTINGQRISTLQLADWSMQTAGQELNAPSIDNLIITGRADVPGTAANEALPGNSGEAMILGDTSTDANTFSIGSMSIAGTLGDIQATGRIGNITAGAIGGQLQASTFGSVVTTGNANGEILATGAPGVSQSIGVVSIGGDATTLTIATNQGAIGQIGIAGRALNLTVASAKAMGSLTVGGSLDASRVQTRNVVGAIRVGGMSDTEIQVGVGLGFAGIATSAADFANGGASLQIFAVTGIAGQPTASWVTGTNTISASTGGTWKLRNVDSSDSLQMYVLNPASPTLVRYSDSANPGNNFLWRPGSPLPAMLAAMLHDV